MNVCMTHNLRISFKLRKTPIGLTDRSFFSVFFYTLLLYHSFKSSGIAGGAGGLPIDLSMNTTAIKTMRLTMEPKMMDMMPYGLPTNSQYTPAIEPSTMDQMPAPAVAFFHVRPSRNAANGPADLMVKANTSIGMMALLTREMMMAMIPRNSTHRRL